MDLKAHVRNDLASIIKEWKESKHLHSGDLFVIGCSTSEVAASISAQAAAKTLQQKSSVRFRN